MKHRTIQNRLVDNQNWGMDKGLSPECAEEDTCDLDNLDQSIPGGFPSKAHFRPSHPDEDVRLGSHVTVLPRPGDEDDVDPGRDPGRGPALPRDGMPGIPGIILTPTNPGEISPSGPREAIFTVESGTAISGGRRPNGNQVPSDNTRPSIAAVTTDVVAYRGDSIILRCIVRNYNSDKVSWLRIQGRSTELLSVGPVLTTFDQRFSVSMEGPQRERHYILRLDRILLSDSATYRCLVPTRPAIHASVPVTVLTTRPSLSGGPAVVDESTKSGPFYEENLPGGGVANVPGLVTTGDGDDDDIANMLAKIGDSSELLLPGGPGDVFRGSDMVEDNEELGMDKDLSRMVEGQPELGMDRNLSQIVEDNQELGMDKDLYRMVEGQLELGMDKDLSRMVEGNQELEMDRAFSRMVEDNQELGMDKDLSRMVEGQPELGMDKDLSRMVEGNQELEMDRDFSRMVEGQQELGMDSDLSRMVESNQKLGMDRDRCRMVVDNQELMKGGDLSRMVEDNQELGMDRDHSRMVVDNQELGMDKD
ncbi:PREDICTED: uncharacterized protein LOC106816143 [Priapulus caudatus]|uniref:Uncharacterized protein LOC106816143 n=1 Tax=Priapulus caudatus TaxID=37621 RepID=A0ABM1EVG4_PRICU|nr:PREDICTED: uncharacterized protein LOC106816143 [Priapulus caudatus]